MPERFPPLKERLADWSRFEVINEIGKTIGAEGPIKAFPNRDKILFVKALSRGLSAEELRSILAPAGPHNYWGRRVDAFMTVLVEHLRVSKYHDLLAKLALEYGQMPVEGRFAAEAMFSHLARAKDENFSKEAIECVARCQWKDGAFAYLALRATPESSKLLEEAALPEQLHSRRAAVLERMRRQLQAENR